MKTIPLLTQTDSDTAGAAVSVNTRTGGVTEGVLVLSSTDGNAEATYEVSYDGGTTWLPGYTSTTVGINGSDAAVVPLAPTVRINPSGLNAGTLVAELLTR